MNALNLGLKDNIIFMGDFNVNLIGRREREAEFVFKRKIQFRIEIAQGYSYDEFKFADQHGVPLFGRYNCQSSRNVLFRPQIDLRYDRRRKENWYDRRTRAKRSNGTKNKHLCGVGVEINVTKRDRQQLLKKSKSVNHFAKTMHNCTFAHFTWYPIRI